MECYNEMGSLRDDKLLTAAGMYAANPRLLRMAGLRCQQQLCCRCCSAARQLLHVHATAAAV
jgi:hypothetical protein